MAAGAIATSNPLPELSAVLNDLLNHSVAGYSLDDTGRCFLEICGEPLGLYIPFGKGSGFRHLTLLGFAGSYLFTDAFDCSPRTAEQYSIYSQLTSE